MAISLLVSGGIDGVTRKREALPSVVFSVPPSHEESVPSSSEQSVPFDFSDLGIAPTVWDDTFSDLDSLADTPIPPHIMDYLVKYWEEHYASIPMPSLKCLKDLENGSFPEGFLSESMANVFRFVLSKMQADLEIQVKDVLKKLVLGGGDDAALRKEFERLSSDLAEVKHMRSCFLTYEMVLNGTVSLGTLRKDDDGHYYLEKFDGVWGLVTEVFLQFREKKSSIVYYVKKLNTQTEQIMEIRAQLDHADYLTEDQRKALEQKLFDLSSLSQLLNVQLTDVRNQYQEYLALMSQLIKLYSDLIARLNTAVAR